MRLPIPLIAAAAPLLLAGPAHAQRPAAPYRALGTEPGWTLTIDARQMRYNGDYGETKVAVPTPRVRTIRNGRRYVTRQMTVEIVNRECSDGMSDRRYADTVRVTVRGRTHQGCGGAVWESPELAGGIWQIERLGKVPLRGTAPPTIQFVSGRISASPGCNAHNGRYRIAGGRLIAGPLASTRRMCPPALMRRDAEFAAILGQPLTLTSPREGRLLLTAPDGKQIALRRR